MQKITAVGVIPVSNTASQTVDEPVRITKDIPVQSASPVFNVRDAGQYLVRVAGPGYEYQYKK